MTEIALKIPRSQKKNLKIIHTNPKKGSAIKQKKTETLFTQIFSLGDSKKPIDINLDNVPKDLVPIEIAKEEAQKAYDKGFEDGQISEIAVAKAEIKKYIDSMQSIDRMTNTVKGQFEEIIFGLQKSSIDLAVKLAENIIKEEIIKDKSLIIKGIKNAFEEIESGISIKLRLSQFSIDILNLIESELLEDNPKFEKIELIIDNSLELGDIIVETSAGNINAIINSQLSNLRKKLYKELDKVLQSKEKTEYRQLKERLKDDKSK